MSGAVEVFDGERKVSRAPGLGRVVSLSDGPRARTSLWWCLRIMAIGDMIQCEETAISSRSREWWLLVRLAAQRIQRDDPTFPVPRKLYNGPDDTHAFCAEWRDPEFLRLASVMVRGLSVLVDKREKGGQGSRRGQPRYPDGAQERLAEVMRVLARNRLIAPEGAK